MFADESEREQFFEAAKAQAQKDFQEDSSNAHALVRWGGALLELAHFKQGAEADQCIQDAIAKLQQALSIDPERTDAEWCLGNAYTSMGFLAPDRKAALGHFATAEEFFKHCREREPGNETYRKALDMCKKAPEYYDEIQQQLQQAQAAGAVSGGPGGRGGGRGGSGDGGGGDDFWWDAAGWVTLGAIIVGVMLLSRGGGGGGGAAAAAK